MNDTKNETKRGYWRSLDELAQSSRVAELVDQEFPGYDPEHMVGTSRRDFVKFAGAGLALAGLATVGGCRRWPEEEIVPFTSAPSETIPGRALSYATVYELGGVGHGLLATAYDGRPTKVEGNPNHPFAVTVAGKIGSATQFAQATVLDMYDPDRSRVIINRTTAKPEAGTWAEFVEVASEKLAKAAAPVILSEAMSGPTVAALKKELLAAYPKLEWVEYEPISHDAQTEAGKLLTGAAVREIYDLSVADVVVLLDADLFSAANPGHVRYQADWAARRKVEGKEAVERGISRVYMAESTYSVTGSNADERLPIKPSRVDAIARGIAVGVGVSGVSAPDGLSAMEKAFVENAVADLKKAGKNAVVAAGSHLNPATVAVAMAINAALGASSGGAVKVVALPDGARPSHSAAIVKLAEQLNAGSVDVLLIVGGNPAFDAPVDVKFEEAIKKVGFSAHLSLYDNETSVACKWHVNRAHYLESWTDARALDGTVSIGQPIILPLFDGKSPAEFLAAMAGDKLAKVTGEALVRQANGLGDDKAWRKVLHDGVIPGTAYAAATVKVGGEIPQPAPMGTTAFELRFLPDSKMYDGRFANNGWLNELPDAMTKIVWDNALLLSKKDSETLGVTTGSVVKVTVGTGLAALIQDVAVYVMPGQPNGSAAVALGYGRRVSGKLGVGQGFPTYNLRGSTGWHVVGADIRSIGESYQIVTTQEHHLIDWSAKMAISQRIGDKGVTGKIARETTFVDFKADEHSANKKSHGKMSLQLFDPPNTFNTPHAWGMAIDMNACTGCMACVTACQAENNIPVVGKSEAYNHRIMQWIRIDRYFKHDPVNDADVQMPDTIHMPMLCLHCENAPCEQVCPVAATVHDTEGLNTMIYNRCIGTRYCSNNCPYKVRRFNYLDYQSKDPRGGKWPWLDLPDTQQMASVDKIKQMVFNPQVSVRMRGVMEKCTYCVQRIKAKTIPARNHKEEVLADGTVKWGNVVDGDIITACQQVCPTQALVFGDLNDAESQVSKLRRSPRSYDVLEELNTRPRSKHMAKVRNPVAGAVAEAKAPTAHG